MRERLSQFGISDLQLDGIGNIQLQQDEEKLSLVLGLVEIPDSLDHFKRLPPASLNKAMKLLQQAMGCISPADENYNDLRTALMRLQRADSTANLEAPDLTPHITDISDESFAKGGKLPLLFLSFYV
jgi:hypothetical protein